MEKWGAYFRGIKNRKLLSELTPAQSDDEVDLEPTIAVPSGASLGIDFTAQMAEFGAGYRVATWGNTDVEPIIGLRWTSQDLGVKLEHGPELIDTSVG